MPSRGRTIVAALTKSTSIYPNEFIDDILVYDSSYDAPARVLHVRLPAGWEDPRHDTPAAIDL